MKIAVIQLTYQSQEEHWKVIADNLLSAGYAFTPFNLSIKGLSKALNIGLEIGRNFDATMFLANDITEPHGWLSRRAQYARDNVNSGLISIPIGQIFDTAQQCDVIGNFLITKEAFMRVGYFTDDFGEYGPIDLDYNHRIRKAGLQTTYLPHVSAGSLSINGDTKYGFSKSEKVQSVWAKHSADAGAYMDGSKDIHIDAPEYTINMNEWLEP